MAGRLTTLALGLLALGAAAGCTTTPAPAGATLAPTAAPAPAATVAAAEGAPAAGAVSTTATGAVAAPAPEPTRTLAAPQVPAPTVAVPQVVVPPAAAARAPEPLRGPLAGWMETTRSTFLRAGAADTATSFNELPRGAALKVLEARADWALVAYAGDGRTRSAGTAWVRAGDLAPLGTLPGWVRTQQPAPFQPQTGGAAAPVGLPAWSWLQLAGREQDGKLLVRYPGDGRERLPAEGWVDAAAVLPARDLAREEFPRAFPRTAQPAAGDVRIRVPYRSQLDGTAWASANCGPTTIGMALDAFGLGASSRQLRDEVLNAQELWGDDVGSFIEALAQVGQKRGLRTIDLFEENGRLKRWTTDDVRKQVLAGRPVIAQVYFRALPGRSQSAYDSDHYIIITGLLGESFLYNDSIDSDGIGYDRVVTPQELSRAMDASDRKYAYSAFAVERR